MEASTRKGDAMIMCAYAQNERSTGAPARTPVEELTDLLSKYDILVNPLVLELVIKAHWWRISTLAHAIHDEHWVGC